MLLAKDLARRLLAAPLRTRPVLTGWDAVADYLRAGLAGVTQEQLRALYLDKRNRLILVHLTVNALGSHGERLNPRRGVSRRGGRLSRAASAIAA